VHLGAGWLTQVDPTGWFRRLLDWIDTTIDTTKGRSS